MILAIDFDGVIHDWKHPKPGRKMGEPISGARESLQAMRQKGHQIIIHSCNRPSVIADWMAWYKIPYNNIWQDKPVADWYVDDRGLQFQSWEQVMRDLAKNAD